jgi:hypothetical protein
LKDQNQKKGMLVTTSAQRILENASNVIFKVSKKISLHVALMIMSSERKNYTAIARSTGVKYHKAYVKKYDIEEYIEESVKFLHLIIKNRASQAKKCFLILDFTLLRKQFSKHIPFVTYDHDGVEKRVNKGFSAAFSCWSDGKVTIPFDFSLWLRKKDAGELYIKKNDVVKKLIKLAQQYEIPFDEVRLDGAFATEDMIKFFVEECIHFTMRMPKNRVVKSSDEEYQLMNHPQLKMMRNQKFKTISASYKGIPLYFTAQKRNGNNDKKEIVFIVSDVQRSAKEHVKAYEKRWPGEKFNRTSKQSLGVSHCQSINPDKQRFHVFAVMVSYAVLQLMQIDQRKQSVEETLHPIRRQKKIDVLFQYLDLEKTFMN